MRPKALVLDRTPVRILAFLVSLINLTFLGDSYAYEVENIENGGELVGSIKISGKPPSNAILQVVNNPDFCGSSVEEEKYVIGPNHGLKNAVVRVQDIKRGKSSTRNLVVIENKSCHFVPHVQTGMVGESYEIRNSDPVLHNTHLHQEDSTLLNIAMPSSGKNIKKEILETGIINVKCDVHRFLQGCLFITDNPYMAVSDKEGRFKISDIPPGKYKISFWHEAFSEKVKEMEIIPKKRTELVLDFK